MSVATDKDKPGLKNCTVNLRDLTILIADPGTYMRRVVYGMLRGFGANRILEVGDASGVLTAVDQFNFLIPYRISIGTPIGELSVRANAVSTGDKGSLRAAVE